MSTILALLPTGDALGSLRELDRPAIDGLRWEPERRWHVTIRYSPHRDEATQATLAEAADEAAAALLAPEVALGPATERLGRDGTLVVPAAGAELLARSVDEALVGVLGDRDEPFYGHLTLARLGRSTVLPDALVGLGIESTFTPSGLYLIESNPGPDGSVYDVVHVAGFRDLGR
jgi:2'-5' RNA ligase